MRNIKLILEYDGSRYDGWQKQGNTDCTIQGKLEQILERLTGETVEIHGSGRTDAGVHALGQVANFHTHTTLSLEQLKEELNRYLPEDIRIWEISEAENRFHSRLNAVRKTYCYRIDTGKKKSVFQRKYEYGLGQELDVEAMKQAAVFLIGSHDFKSFCGNKKMKKSTVRTMERIHIHEENGHIEISYQADGFLYHMVRILTGTLIETGLGKRKPEEMKTVLEAKNRQAAGYTAPPEGLFLVQVEY